MRLLICMGILSSLFGCKTTKPIQADLFPALNYEYKDGSVPPKYHRSYKISINEKGASTLRIYSYGDTLFEDNRQLTKSEMDDLKTKYNALGNTSSMSMDGKVGGKSKYLVAKSGGKELLNLSWNNEESATMQILVAAMKGLYPNLSTELSK